MRVAVIGIGGISKLHLHALIQTKQDIVALCDVDISKCEKACAEFSLSAAIYQDYVKMLDEVKPEVVHICTPHYLHAPMCCAALSRNIHVLCEKPLAINEAQLKEIEAAVKTSSAQLGVCHQNRFKPAVLYTKELLAEREIEAATAIVHWKRDRAYYDSGDWRGKWETEGGGVMINQALHTLDLLQWFCGYPEWVKATISNESLEGVIEVEDTAFGRFGMANGGNFMIHATNAASDSFPVELMFRSEKHTIRICGDTVMIKDRQIVKEDNTPLFGKEEWGVGHLHLIENFYGCIANGEPFAIDFAEGSKVVRLILGMYESKGRELSLT